MELMDAWTKFFQTGNVLDYLKYSAIRDSQQYFNDDNDENNENKITGDSEDNSIKS